MVLATDGSKHTSQCALAMHIADVLQMFSMPALDTRKQLYLRHTAYWWLQLQVQHLELQVQHLELQEGSMGPPLVLLQGHRRGMDPMHAHTCHV